MAEIISEAIERHRADRDALLEQRRILLSMQARGLVVSDQQAMKTLVTQIGYYTRITDPFAFGLDMSKDETYE